MYIEEGYACRGPSGVLVTTKAPRWLAHRPEAAGEARKITTELLTRWSVAEGAADSVLLTVSELVINAVEHVQPPPNIGLSRDPGTVDQRTAAHGDRAEPGRAVHWADVTSVP
ncbi:ATP-binding protein [Streptomyces yokosukanensis]|uniref:ATP-binding protein n=1 Tax=Streptomyces yokosukanensis TaxID=67386 RepID=UPI00342EB075